MDLLGVEKVVKFIDFDGTVLYEYTKAETLALTALPTPPNHSTYKVPLTFDEWNWSLADIKTQLDEVGGEVTVGAVYHPTDGKTHIFVEVDDNDTWGVEMSVSGTVDWGGGWNY